MKSFKEYVGFLLLLFHTVAMVSSGRVRRQGDTIQFVDINYFIWTTPLQQCFNEVWDEHEQDYCRLDPSRTCNEKTQGISIGFGLPNVNGGGGQTFGNSFTNLLGGLLGQPINPAPNSNPPPATTFPSFNIFNPFTPTLFRPQGEVSALPQIAACSRQNGGCQQTCVDGGTETAICGCDLGYFINNDLKTCTDFDECSLNQHNCQVGQTCVNTEGSFSCTAGTQFQPQPPPQDPPQTIPEPQPSCDVNNGGCEHRCRVRRNGRIRCACRRGFELQGDGRSCLQTGPVCADNNGGCEHRCRDTRNGIRCACRRGFVLQSDGKSCQSPENGGGCAVNNGGCQHRCRQNRRGLRCSCRRGFVLQNDGKSCQSLGNGSGCAVNNGGCQHRCRQNRRGLRCSCRRGFALGTDEKSCTDIDECATDTHDCTEICVNTEGSFKCTTAVDQAGCAVNNGGCEQRCRDTRKGIKCACRKNFVLQADGKSCASEGPVIVPTPSPDPCQINNGGCEQLCVNNNGNIECQCQQGFILAGGRCQRPIIPPGGDFSGPGTALPPIQDRGCGVNTKKSLFRRIVGGKPADPKDWPWMAAILRTIGNQQFCGGSLISDRHVLTAAHCLIPFSSSDQIKVRLGEYDFSTPDDNNPTDFSVREMKIHESYDRNTQENDIAIIKLSRPTTFSEFIWPVCLPPSGNSFEDQLGYVTGWGTIDFGGRVSSVLQEVIIPVWNHSACVAAYPNNVVTNNMMCAGLREGGKDSCQGDSGGPFLVQIFPATTWYVSGIVSWGIECAKPENPGVYTRVNRYLGWIDANTKD